MVAARLQCDINGCSFRRFGTMCQRIPLRMQLSVPFVISFPDNFFIFYDHGSHQRIRGYLSRSFFRQFECSPHISFICHKFLHTTKSPGQFLLRASFGCVLLLGLDGIIWAQPIADFCCIALSIFMFAKTLRTISAKNKCEM